MNTYIYYSKNGGFVIKSVDGLFTSPIIKEDWVYLLNQMNANADLIPLKFISDLLPTVTLEEHQSMFDGLCATHGNIELIHDNIKLESKAFSDLQPSPNILADSKPIFQRVEPAQSLSLICSDFIERGYHV